MGKTPMMPDDLTGQARVRPRITMCYDRSQTLA